MSQEVPPVVFVHGAANSAGVWTYWQARLAEHGWQTTAINLRGHGDGTSADLSRASMWDYAADVIEIIRKYRTPPAIFGWSMGGLVAMMVAQVERVAACVCLAPSMPARKMNDLVSLRTGVFGPEEYGITSKQPNDQPTMPDLDQEERTVALASLTYESRLARDERRAGIVIKSLACPLLIVTGAQDSQWPRATYKDLWLKADFVEARGASHWGLVLSRRALVEIVPVVSAWLEANVGRHDMPLCSKPDGCLHSNKR